MSVDVVDFSPLTTGDTGFCIDAIDPDGSSPSQLVVTVTNSNQSPANGGNGPTSSTPTSGQAIITRP